jgi:hypothetical protein
LTLTRPNFPAVSPTAKSVSGVEVADKTLLRFQVAVAQDRPGAPAEPVGRRGAAARSSYRHSSEKVLDKKGGAGRIVTCCG